MAIDTEPHNRFAGGVHPVSDHEAQGAHAVGCVLAA
jgi:hypothetical protein